MNEAMHKEKRLARCFPLWLFMAGTTCIASPQFIGLKASGGYEGLFWWINPFGADTSVVDYRTEGLQAASVDGAILVMDRRLVFFSYATTLGNPARQREISATNETRGSGLTQWTAAGSLNPFGEALTENDLGSILIRSILSFRSVYTRQLFFGETKAKVNAVLVPRGALIDYKTGTVYGATSLYEGERLYFRTEFEDIEFSATLYRFFMNQNYQWSFGEEIYSGDREVQYDLRLGCYASGWERLSANSSLTVDGDPVIYEARYRSRGILVSLENSKPESGGLNVDASARIGIRSYLDAAYDWEQLFESDELTTTTTSVMLGAKLWYNWYLGAEERGVVLSSGIDGSFKVFNVDLKEKNEEDTEDEAATYRFIHDNDLILKAYLKVSFRI